MLENFSRQAVKLIEEAKILAQKMESPLVGSEHLLLAMYEMDDSICRFLLQERSIEKEELFEIVESSIVLRKKEFDDLIYTKKFQDIVLKAKDVALLAKSEFVFDEHLFYSMLQEETSVAKDILIRLGLNIDELTDDIEDIFGFNQQTTIQPFPFLTNLSSIDKPHDYVKRSNHLERIKIIMNKKQKNNPMLIGNAGVGKTAIIEGLALELKNETIYRLDLGGIIAGTKYRGELEEKIIKAMEFIKEQKAILFIDEIHNIVGAGSNEGSLDIANILKPYLARSDIRCIGATTLDEYYRFIEKDKALLRRFQNIYVDEPTPEETKVILNGIKHFYEDYHLVKYSDENIDEIIIGCYKFIPARAFPDKAIDVLDEVGARKKTYPPETKLSIIIDDVIKDMSGISSIEMETLRDLYLNYEELRFFYVRFLEGLSNNKNIVVIRIDYDFSVELLKKDLYNVFNFKDEMFLEINFENYHDPSMINNLIGPSKGYVGYDSGGILSEHLIKYPLALIYFNNLEASHLQIQNFLKKIMQSSSFIDNKGRTINLRNTIFLFDLKVEPKQVIGLIEGEKKYDSAIYDIYIKGSKEVITLKPDISNNSHYQRILKKNHLNVEFKDFPETIQEMEKIIYQLLMTGRGDYLIKKINNQYIYEKK